MRLFLRMGRQDLVRRTPWKAIIIKLISRMFEEMQRLPSSILIHKILVSLRGRLMSCGHRLILRDKMKGNI